MMPTAITRQSCAEIGSSQPSAVSTPSVDLLMARTSSQSLQSKPMVTNSNQTIAGLSMGKRTACMELSVCSGMSTVTLTSCTDTTTRLSSTFWRLSSLAHPIRLVLLMSLSLGHPLCQCLHKYMLNTTLSKIRKRQYMRSNTLKSRSAAK